MSEKEAVNRTDLQDVVGGTIAPRESPDQMPEAESKEKSPLTNADLASLAGGGDPRGTRGIPEPTDEPEAETQRGAYSPPKGSEGGVA